MLTFYQSYTFLQLTSPKYLSVANYKYISKDIKSRIFDLKSLEFYVDVKKD